MIELNLTYEESKKILELGYDFGRKFGDTYKKRDCPHKYILVNYEKIKAQDYCQVAEKYHGTYLERFTLERQSIDYEDSLYNNKHNEYFELGEILCNPNSEGFVPTIPKAALEACLPEHEEDGIWYIWLGYTRCMTQSPDECDTSSLEHFLSNPDINSAYEAFLWCHENYPEELTAKFDEVMA
jgi:hypothetical protein